MPSITLEPISNDVGCILVNCWYDDTEYIDVIPLRDKSVEYVLCSILYCEKLKRVYEADYQKKGFDDYNIDMCDTFFDNLSYLTPIAGIRVTIREDKEVLFIRNVFTTGNEITSTLNPMYVIDNHQVHKIIITRDIYKSGTFKELRDKIVVHIDSVFKDIADTFDDEEHTQFRDLMKQVIAEIDGEIIAERRQDATNIK